MTTAWQWQAAPPTERRALCISASYPGTSLALPGTVPDQEALASMLSRSGYRVRFLSDASRRHLSPTRANIEAEVSALCRWLDGAPNRQAWISYSGHGSQVKDRSGDEADGLDEVIVPCDYEHAGFITDDALKRMIRFGRGSSLMLFMDCCHSGTMLDLPYTLNHTLTGPEYASDGSNGSIFCISAALDDQSAYETAEGGICTRAFLGAYRPGVSPAETLSLMRKYAAAKRMPQTITMHSNRQFTADDAAFCEAPLTHSLVESLCACLFGGESTESRELRRRRDALLGRAPPLGSDGRPLPNPLDTAKGRARIAALRQANGFSIAAAGAKTCPPLAAGGKTAPPPAALAMRSCSNLSSATDAEGDLAMAAAIRDVTAISEGAARAAQALPVCPTPSRRRSFSTKL